MENETKIDAALERQLMSLLCPSGMACSHAARVELAERLRQVAARIESQLTAEDSQRARQNVALDQGLMHITPLSYSISLQILPLRERWKYHSHDCSGGSITPTVSEFHRL
jgi:hypothetical protein